MGGTDFSEEPTFRLKLLVDKEKNKVVLAEVGKDFVDVLFSFLLLPMGTIVRLLRKHHENQKSQTAATTIGCFNNLYKSVVDMSNDNFLTEACKDILLYPIHAKERPCKRLKLNIDDTTTKYYRCPDLGNSQSCSKAYSNFCSLKCVCGKFMEQEIKVRDGVLTEIFVSDKKSFIILDNMKVRFNSIALTLKSLRELGYTDLDKLDEMLVDVGHKEVLALLECLFSADTPLTDAFLMKRKSCIITRTHNMPSLATVQDGGKAESNEILSVTVFVRKQDKKVLYAESGQDFVDLLLMFLAVPLESVWGISGNNIELGCIENFCKSMRSLSSSQATNASTCISKLPWNYSFQAPLLGVCSKLDPPLWTLKINSQSYDLKMMYPNYDGSEESTIQGSNGLLKRGTTYMISDDLTISATNSSSTICILKKWNVDLDDIEEHVIDISKKEAIGLLRASLMTSTALTTALGSLLLKKPKKEKP
ncbi:unnamed protein product [Microthlaspi erraticum]|uniref:DUF674 domain-containing protein n=1 Tax=Microthlaspi erraticum TaxID=1685480 RepID=A0A6D2KMV4_9BRAS|nr:unnamed protein product [Microthlaspi erraticum]